MLPLHPQSIFKGNGRIRTHVLTLTGFADQRLEPLDHIAMKNKIKLWKYNWQYWNRTNSYRVRICCVAITLIAKNTSCRNRTYRWWFGVIRVTTTLKMHIKDHTRIRTEKMTELQSVALPSWLCGQNKLYKNRTYFPGVKVQCINHYANSLWILEIGFEPMIFGIKVS